MESFDLSLRQRKLLHILQNLSGYITGAELARQLRVSPRTIRSDVAEINRMLAPYRAQIGSVHSKGYLFEAEDPDSIRRMNQIDTAFFTREDRVRYLAFLLCLSDSPLSLLDLEDEMFVSRTTLQNDLHHLSMKFSVGTPHLALNRSGDRIAFERDEKKRRSVLNQLLGEDWNYNETGNAYYSFDFLDENVLSWIMDEMPVCLMRHYIVMEDCSLVMLNLAAAILYHRVCSGYILPEAAPVPRKDAEADLACREFFTAAEAHFHCSFPIWEQDEIYLNIASGHLMDASALSFDTVGQYFSADTLDIADRYLREIEETFRLDFRADEDFYITLLQYIRYLKTPVHPFNAQGNQDISREALLTEYEIAWLFQDIAADSLGYYLNQSELLYLAHCISGALEYLYRLHPEAKFKTVIACHLNLAATWGLKRKILGAFDNYLDITALLPVNAKSGFDFSDTDLVLTTVNKPITNHPGTDVLQISPLMSPADHRNVEDYIQKKRSQMLCPNAAYSLKTLLETAFFHRDFPDERPFSILETLADDFVGACLVPMAYLEDVLRRESVSSFAFRQGILFIHSLFPAVKTRLSIACPGHTIYWNAHKIRLIVMAALRPDDRPLLFRLQYVFCSTPVPWEDLKTLETKEDVCNYFCKK